MESSSHTYPLPNGEPEAIHFDSNEHIAYVTALLGFRNATEGSSIASACVREAKSKVFAIALQLRSHGARLFVATNGDVAEHTTQFLRQVFNIMSQISKCTKRVKLKPDGVLAAKPSPAHAPPA